MAQIKLLIDPVSPAKTAYEREFENRHEAQVFIDTLYAAEEIDREQWAKLFDHLSTSYPR